MARKPTLNSMIFVFGSNDAGIHGAGAAKYALREKGALWGKSYGHYGNSFAIPTKSVVLETLPMDRIYDYLAGFLAYAKGHPKIDFQITRVGCGLAGLKDAVIGPMFHSAPTKNCYFDEQWFPWLGNNHQYWGTF